MSRKTILITGSSRCIGRRIALLFASRGYHVFLNSHSSLEALEQVREEIERQGAGICTLVPGDVGDPGDVARIFQKIKETCGHLDILVNSAGVVRPGNVCEVSEETIDEVLGVNVKGVFFASKYAIEEMLKVGGGSIVHVASAACMYGVKNRSIYSASKGAVVALTRAMAVDHAHQHIRVNAICPGATVSPSMEARFNESPDPQAMRAQFIANHPIGRLAEPIEIARTVVFIASEDSSFTTGAAIMVDGGVSL